MQQHSDQASKASRLRRLKAFAITATAGVGLVLWGAVSGAVAASTNSAAPSSQPITQTTSNDDDFFGGEDGAPALGQANVQPITRSGGS